MFVDASLRAHRGVAPLRASASPALAGRVMCVTPHRTPTNAQEVGDDVCRHLAQAKLAAAESTLGSLKADLRRRNVSLCAQCDLRLRVIVLFPCRHLAICDGPFCKGVKKCPLCTAEVQQRVPIKVQ